MRRSGLFALLVAGCGSATATPADPGDSPSAPSESVGSHHGPEVVSEPDPEPDPEPKSAVPDFTCLEIQPLGPVPPESLAAIEEAIADTYRVDVVMQETRPLPDAAYYPPRKRYRAEKLLVHLESNMKSDCEHVLGVTTKDISTTKGPHQDWGILGLGDMPGTASVISTFRTKKAVREIPPNERLARVAIHEVGHTLGLPHCPTHGCMLSDAGGTVKTIDTETELCAVCRKRLRWRGEPPKPRRNPD